MKEYKITIFKDYSCELTMSLSICQNKATYSYSSVIEKVLICLN